MECDAVYSGTESSRFLMDVRLPSSMNVTQVNNQQEVLRSKTFLLKRRWNSIALHNFTSEKTDIVFVILILLLPYLATLPIAEIVQRRMLWRLVNEEFREM
jgi:hypothetical protein